MIVDGELVHRIIGEEARTFPLSEVQVLDAATVDNDLLLLVYDKRSWHDDIEVYERRYVLVRGDGTRLSSGIVDSNTRGET